MPIVHVNPDLLARMQAARSGMTGALGGPISGLLSLGFRNVIINGDFSAWQRGICFTQRGYTADRWQVDLLPDVEWTVRRQQHSNGEYFNGLKLEIHNRVGAQTFLRQSIEGVGTFQGQTASLSFKGWATRPTAFRVSLVQVFVENDPGVLPQGVSTQVRVSSPVLILGPDTQDYHVAFNVPAIDWRLGPGDEAYAHLDVTFEFVGPVENFIIGLSQVQLEAGPPSEFEIRDNELLLCQRYYQSHQPVDWANRETPHLVGYTMREIQGSGLIYAPYIPLINWQPIADGNRRFDIIAPPEGNSLEEEFFERHPPDPGAT